MLACGGISLAVAADAPPAVASLELDGKTLRIPPPPGMALLAVMSSLPAGLVEVPKDLGKSPKSIAMFVPDSMLASMVRTRRAPGPDDPTASVTPWPLDHGKASEARSFIRDMRQGGGLLAGERAPDELRSLREPLESDPYGVADLPIEIPGSANLDLRVIDLGSTGFGSVLAARSGSGPRDGRWRLRATGTLVVEDRALFAVLFTNLPPTTGGVAALRGRFIEWVGDIVFANHPEAAKRTASSRRGAGHPPGKLPELGDLVYVEELPQAVLRVTPLYPEDARKRAIEGEVLVQALVDPAGKVVKTRVARSIPGLNESAVQAVRHWRFLPARDSGGPIAVWVDVPVTFTLR